MVHVKCKPDHAVVPVTGIIEEKTILPLVAAIQQLHHEYFNTCIELEVNSPGGQTMALDYCVEAMDELRARGVRFTTRALMDTVTAQSARQILTAVDKFGRFERRQLLSFGARRGARAGSRSTEAIKEG